MPEPIAEHATLGAETSPPAERDDARDDGAPPPARACAHEALLERHGLISHVAELGEDATDATATEFLRDVSRLAQNAIRLSHTRFGLLLGPDLPADISAVPHRLIPIASAEIRRNGSGTDPADELNAQPDSVGAPDPAPPAPPAAQDGASAPLSPEALTGMLGPILEASLERHLAPIARANADLRAERSRWQEDVARFWEGMEAVLRLMNETAARLIEAEASLAAKRASPAMTQDDAAALRPGRRMQVTPSRRCRRRLRRSPASWTACARRSKASRRTLRTTMGPADPRRR